MSFIDLMSSTVWSQDDIARRAQRTVLQQFTRQQIRDLDDMVTGQAQGLYQLTEAEQALVAQYAAAKLKARADRLEAEADNALLIQVLAYEQAQRDVEVLSLRINGRVAIDAEIDPETQQIVVPAVDEIVAMDEQDEAFQAVVEALEASFGVINQATSDVITLCQERAAHC